MSQNNIEKEIGILIGKVDSLIHDVGVIRKGTEHKIEELDTRVHSIEKKQYTIVIIASLFFTGVMTFARKFF